jgi:hypothetical protein
MLKCSRVASHRLCEIRHRTQNNNSEQPVQWMRPNSELFYFLNIQRWSRIWFCAEWQAWALVRPPRQSIGIHRKWPEWRRWRPSVSKQVGTWTPEFWEQWSAYFIYSLFENPKYVNHARASCDCWKGWQNKAGQARWFRSEI